MKQYQIYDTQKLQAQFLEREEQYKYEVNQLEQELASLKELIEEKNYELESNVHQNRMKENGFANALQSLQEKEELVIKQDRQIQDLLDQMEQMRISHQNEVATIKRVAENLVRTDPRQNRSLIMVNKENGSAKKVKSQKTPTKRIDTEPFEDVTDISIYPINDKIIQYKAENQVNLMVNQLILDQKEWMNRIRGKLTAINEIEQFDRDLERFLSKLGNAFNKVHDLYAERNNLNTLLKDYQYAYDQLKENQENFLQIVKLSLLKIEDNLRLDDQSLQLNVKHVQYSREHLIDQLQRLSDLMAKLQDENKRLRMERKSYNDRIIELEGLLNEANREMEAVQSTVKQKLQNKFDDVTEYDRMMKVIEDLRLENEQLRSREDQRRESLTLQEKLRQAQRTIDDINLLNKNLQKHNDMLKQELELRNEGDELGEQNQQLLDQINQLTQEHAQTMDMLEKAVTELESKEEQTHKLKELLDLSQQNEINLEQQLNEYQMQAGEMENHIASLQHELEQQEMYIQDLEKRNQQYIFDIQEYDHRFKLMKNQYEESEPQNDNLEQVHQKIDAYIYRSLGGLSDQLNRSSSKTAHSFESFARFGDPHESGKVSKRSVTRSQSQNPIYQKFLSIQECIDQLITSDFIMMEGMIELLQPKKDSQLFNEWVRDLRMFRDHMHKVGLQKFVNDFSEWKRLFIEVLEVHLKEKDKKKIKPDFSGGQIEMLSRFNESIHAFAQKQLQTISIGDKVFVDRLEHIVRKYKSLGSINNYKNVDNVFSKRALSHLTSTCQILYHVFRAWKDHVIMVSEILFEAAEGGRQIAHAQYDEEQAFSRFMKFENKITQTLQLLEREAFSTKIDQNLIQMENEVDKIQEISLTDTIKHPRE